MATPPLSFTTTWRVRSYELDGNGHVNNSVYLAYAEEIATLHAEALGFGRQWTLDRGGMWVVHKHEIVYQRPAVYGDYLALTTRVVEMRGARAVRETTIALIDGPTIASLRTDWVWVRASDGRPQRIPAELLAGFGPLLSG
jgi:acyl-CoA thioester hydrolase